MTEVYIVFRYQAGRERVEKVFENKKDADDWACKANPTYCKEFAATGALINNTAYWVREFEFVPASE